MKQLLRCTLVIGLLGCSSAEPADADSQAHEASSDEADPDQAVPYRDASVRVTAASETDFADAPGTSIPAQQTTPNEPPQGSGATKIVPEGAESNADQGVVCELRHRFSLPHSGNPYEATTPWVELEQWIGSGAIETTPDGGLYLVGNFGQELDLGAGKLRATGPVSGFLHKLDRDCKPVWTRLLHATFVLDGALPTALTVDGQGNVYVAMVGRPLIDFFPLRKQVLRWATELVVEKFSPRGESLYRTRIPTSLGGALVDIEVDDAGQVYLTGFAPSLTDLGSGRPFGRSLTGFEWFALTLDAEGKFRAQQTETGAAEVEHSGDRVYMLRDQPGSYDLFAMLSGALPWAGELKPALTAYSQTELAPLWSHPLPHAQEGNAVAAEGLAGGGLAVLYNKNSTKLDDRHVIDRSLLVKRYNQDGSLRSAIPLAEQRVVISGEVRAGEVPFVNSLDVTAPQFQYLRESGQGGLVMGGYYSADFALQGTLVTTPSNEHPSGMFGSSTMSGTVIVKAGADDKIRWVRAQDWGPESALRGLSSSANGEVFVAGLARVNATNPSDGDDTWDLVVRKLRAD